MTIDDLRKDFMLRYPNLDYFTLNEIFKFGDMAYCLGADNNQVRKVRCVIRSDGKKYKSLTIAGKRNQVDKAGIATAIKNKHRCRGYYWAYV